MFRLTVIIRSILNHTVRSVKTKLKLLSNYKCNMFRLTESTLGQSWTIL